MNRTYRLLALLAFAALCPLAFGQAQKKEYDDAYREGARLVNAKKFAESQAPLERALLAAANDDQRKQAYQALVPAYRLLPEIDKFLEAQEFNIRHTDRKAGRSNDARDIASFLFQRGKLDLGIQRYEAALKADPKDPAALGVLTTIYSRLKEDKAKAAALTAQQDALNVELATALATRLENSKVSPNSAALLLKDAASVWLEAGDKAKALAAAKKSLAQPPEQRSGILTMQWREGLGDVLLAAGDPALAVQQFEAAVAAANPGPLKQRAEKKLAEAKAAAEKKP